MLNPYNNQSVANNTNSLFVNTRQQNVLNVLDDHVAMQSSDVQSAVARIRTNNGSLSSRSARNIG